MYNFFIDKLDIVDDFATIKGSDYNHIKNVLRMKVGDQILVSCDKKSSLCEISEFNDDAVIARIIESDYLNSELPIEIYLLQGLPKSDKLEFIIQKTVELGVFAVIPVQMSRSVVKIEDKKKDAKTERWQAIAESAAKQSKRTIIPKIYQPMDYKVALNFAKNCDLFLLPYENEKGMIDTKIALESIKSGQKIAILVGPEGGFSDKEVELAVQVGAKKVSLGKRILRTETASITTVGACMLHAEMNL